VHADKFFCLNNNSLRRHHYKLFKQRFTTNIGQFSFSNRVIDVWNCLPVDVVSCNTVTSFKVKLDHLLQHVYIC